MNAEILARLENSFNFRKIDLDGDTVLNVYSYSDGHLVACRTEHRFFFYLDDYLLFIFKFNYTILVTLLDRNKIGTVKI